jgi:hypothetical protein
MDKLNGFVPQSFEEILSSVHMQPPTFLWIYHAVVYNYHFSQKGLFESSLVVRALSSTQ